MQVRPYDANDLPCIFAVDFPNALDPILGERQRPCAYFRILASRLADTARAVDQIIQKRRHTRLPELEPLLP